VTRRRGMMALPWLLALCSLMLVLGISGSFQLASARRTLDEVHARRLLDLAAASALEEASARLEDAVPAIPYPVAADPRALDATALPGEVPLTAAAADAQADGIALDPVRLTWSGFQRTEHTGPRGTLVRAFGVLQLELHLHAPGVARTVIARRYGSLEPSPDGLRFRVARVNAMLVVTGA